MEVHEVKELMEQFDKSSLTTLELVFHDTTIKMNKKEFDYPPPAPSPVNHSQSSVVTPPPPPLKLNLTGNTAVCAPVGGVFFLAPVNAQGTLLQVGDSVNQGDVLCCIESMKMMTQVKAPITGLIKEISALNEALVGFGELLIEIGE
ncbi:MAG: biotin/lipoyl-containing protein [Eubacteriales bacterium]